MLENLSPLLSNISIYIILFFSLLSNGIFSFPSSQIVYLTFGYILTVKTISATIGILTGTIANTISNYILYRICLGGRDTINTKLANFIDVNKDKITYYENKIKKYGIAWLILGKNIPSVKVFVPILAGLAKISHKEALFVFFVGSLIWACAITYVGFYFGQKLDLKQFYIYYFLIIFAISLVLSTVYNIRKFKK